jgi:uncharacterized membrane protein
MTVRSELLVSDVTWTYVVYGLQGLSALLFFAFADELVTWFLCSLPAVLAVTINYARARTIRGTFLESHFQWQIRSFWSALCCLGLVLLVAVPVIPFLVGFFVLGIAAYAIALWVLYRVARGWIRLTRRLPMHGR